MRIVIVTALTLVAFAANSILCRLALGADLIDPVSFTALRLVSGAVALAVVSRVLPESKPLKNTSGDWVSGFSLFAYAIAFSLAYVSLSAGSGALILFGTVQVTMICAALKSGENVRLAQWIGLAAAISGLAYLALPVLRLLLQTPPHDSFKLRAWLRRRLLKLRRLFLQDRVHHLDCRLAAEWPLTRKHLVLDHAEAEDVRLGKPSGCA